MAFPTIVLVQNISVFLFPFLLKSHYDLGVRVIRIKYFIQIVAVFFAIGAVMSVATIPEGYSANSLSNAIGVLPNYLYWVVLLIVMVNIRKFIYAALPSLYKFVFWGLISSCLYYFFFQHYLTGFDIFKILTQNTFAFLLICFSPIACYYGVKTYGSFGGYFLLLVIVTIGFLSGSRSGSILVLVGSLGGVLVETARKKNIYLFFLLLLVLYLLVYKVPFTRDIVHGLNERTYDLIYRSDETLATDRSYLVRLAMVEKAMEIFEEYPYTGIGLNNFTSYSVKFPGDFVGAKFVIDKRGLNEASAHNSYMGLLAEGGLALLVPFLAILLYCFYSFFRNLDAIPNALKPVFIGLVCMSIHLYFIMAIVNVFAWYLISLACAFAVLVENNEVRYLK